LGKEGKMRLLVTFLLIFNTVNVCQASEKVTDTTAIELSILWRLPVDPATWEIKELEKLLHDSKKFVLEGNFYKPKGKMNVFGHEVLYIGAVGMGEIPGPNAMLKGSPDKIVNYIKEKYKIKFVKEGNEFHGDIKETATAGGEMYRVKIRDYVKLVIAPNPGKKDETIVIGAYLGP